MSWRRYRWRWNELEEALPQTVLNQIAAIQVYPNTGVGDQLFLRRDTIGKFFHPVSD